LFCPAENRATLESGGPGIFRPSENLLWVSSIIKHHDRQSKVDSDANSKKVGTARWMVDLMGHSKKNTNNRSRRPGRKLKKLLIKTNAKGKRFQENLSGDYVLAVS